MTETTEMQPILKIEGLSCPFGTDPGLENISIEVQAGSIFFVLGPSGSGKSTLLRAIAGLIEPKGGRITIDGRLANDPKLKLCPERRGLQMVFQEFALWPHMTVRKQLIFAAGGKKKADSKWIDRVLELTQASEFQNKFPHQLSGGEKQRAALARALASQPRLLLLDEPMRHMDPVLARSMRHEMRDIFTELSMSAVYVTHDQEEAFDLADSMMILRHGRIEAIGAPKDLLDHPPTRYTAEFLGRSNVFLSKVELDGSATTPIGQVSCIGTPGTDVAVRLRPEDISIEKGDGPWRVERYQFGEGKVLAQVTDGSLRLVADAPASLIEIGVSVQLRIIGSAAIIAL